MLRSMTLRTYPKFHIPPYGIATITMVAWASAFPAIRVALESYSPTHLALLRHLVASLILVVFAVYNNLGLPAKKDIPAFMLLGGLGFTIYHISLSYGQTHIPAASASFLIAFAPVIMVLLSTLVLGERLKRWGWLGIAISFGGVTVIAIGRQASFTIDRWTLAVLLSAFAQSCYSLGQRPLLKRYSALQFTTYAIWGGTLMMLPFGGGLIGEMQRAGTEQTLAILYMGIVPSVIGYVMWSSALAKLPAGVAGSFLYIVPPLAMVIAWLWLGELPSVIAMIGGALVLAGVIVLNRWGRIK